MYNLQFILQWHSAPFSSLLCTINHGGAASAPYHERATPTPTHRRHPELATARNDLHVRGWTGQPPQPTAKRKRPVPPPRSSVTKRSIPQFAVRNWTPIVIEYGNVSFFIKTIIILLYYSIILLLCMAHDDDDDDVDVQHNNNIIF